MEPTPPSPLQPALEPEDFYMDGPNLVFTSAYHLKRGYCCGSACRHCPYGEWDRSAPAPAQSPPPAS